MPIASARRVARLLLSVPMLLAVLLVVYLVWAGLLYPLRSDAGGPEAWGGPSLAGAWAVHAAIALAVQVGCLASLRGLARVHDRLGSSVRS